MEQSSQDQLEQLEKLISSLRHDIRGMITPALLIGDRLTLNGDPPIQRSGIMITGIVERIVSTLNATYEVVPPRGR
jgi:hypothetical protein